MLKKFEARAREIVSKMTIREKAGQLNQVTTSFYKENKDELYEMVRKGEIGSLILATTATAGNDTQSLIDLDEYNKIQKMAVEESRLGIPLIYGRDVIHGHKTVLPVPIGSAAAFNDELLEKCYSDVAEEAAADGVHWTFSPMLDMCRDPRWGRMVEGPGEDPFVGASLARAAVKGFQGDDISNPRKLAACAKHYIGYGASEGGRDYFRAEICDSSLYNYYLPAFRAAVEEGVATVMSSFNDINGIPVASSRKYMTEILRDQLGFEGFVVSDWGSIDHPRKMGYAETYAEEAKNSLTAGVDMDMCTQIYLNNAEKLIESGELDEAVLDLAVTRVLCVKLALGLFERPYRERFEYDINAHRKNARQLAAESLVLLKNSGVLPLKKDAKIAVVGPFVREREATRGTWVLDSRVAENMTLCEAFCEAVPKENLRFAHQITLYDNSVKMAKDSDIIVVALGESHMTTGEAQSVSDISLSPDQIRLIDDLRSLGKPMVGVFFCARPRALEGVVDRLDAVVYAWHTGTESAHAVCDVLFGDVVPSGKLPVTLPRRTGHIPLYYNTTASNHYGDNYYGEHEYMSYVDSASTPLYPFGFGLSYTKFEYKNFTCEAQEMTLEAIKNGEKAKFSIEVENIGDFDGKETVQLYIRDRFASIMRPIRELKGYKKVFIEKGKTAKVEFELGYKDLGFYNEKGEYLLEKGLFEIYVGENCLTENKIRFTVV